MKFVIKLFKIIIVTVLSLALLSFLFMQQRSFGKLPQGNRLKRIENSHHYNKQEGIFQNVKDTPMMAEGASYFSMIIDFMSKGVDRRPEVELPVTKTDVTLIDPRVPQLIWFGHSSYLISSDNLKILVDPIFSERASPVQYLGGKRYPGTEAYQAEDFPTIDLMIITHDHYDHLDYHTILKLKEKTNFYVVPLGVGSHLEHWGIDSNKIIELDWWDDKQFNNGIGITATPSRHFSGRGIRRNKTLWASFVLQLKTFKIFIGGDSGYDETFKKIGEEFGPFDIAMLECGQYNTQWPYIHMMPEQVVQAALDLNTTVLLPVHWGKFTLALHAWNEPIKRLTQEAAIRGLNITTPKIGQPVLLNNIDKFSPWWESVGH